MKVCAWLIDFAHFRENCPTGIIPEWIQKVTQHSGIILCHNLRALVCTRLFSWTSEMESIIYRIFLMLDARRSLFCLWIPPPCSHLPKTRRIFLRRFFCCLANSKDQHQRRNIIVRRRRIFSNDNSVPRDWLFSQVTRTFFFPRISSPPLLLRYTPAPLLPRTFFYAPQDCVNIIHTLPLREIIPERVFGGGGGGWDRVVGMTGVTDVVE